MPTIQTNDITTHYETRGDSGPPIVFVHGAILDHSQWMGQVEALADEFTTYTYDVRGHGRTGPTDRDTYSIELLADDLHAFITELGLERPVLCGLSMGGCIAQVYAATHPESISGLVLAGTFTPDYLTLGDRIQRGLILPAAVYPVHLVGYERVERVIVWLNETFGQSGSSGEYERIQAIREDSPSIETGEFAKTMRALRDYHGASIDYTAITVPTLVLHGENEPGFIERHAERLAALIPDASLRAVPGAGHASNLDNPTFYEDTIREFARSVTATSDSDDDGQRPSSGPTDSPDIGG